MGVLCTGVCAGGEDGGDRPDFTVESTSSLRGWPWVGHRSLTVGLNLALGALLPDAFPGTPHPVPSGPPTITAALGPSVPSSPSPTPPSQDAS